MKMRMKKIKTIVAMVLAMIMMTMPVCAEGMVQNGNARFSNIHSAELSIAFDTNNVIYCTLSVEPFSHGSGVSGLMKLFDSDGNCIEIWSVSDYVKPIMAEFTYQGEYGETYTLTFAGYAYSNNGTAADRLELSTTGTCKD